ncbi:MAG: 3'-5' exonuclease [Bacteroidales bacterium]
MKDFVALDFETANQHRSSVCSIGIVIVSNGKIVDKFYKLIQPYPNYYTEWAIECHGLSAQDTIDAPIFPTVWEEITPRIKNLPLVAHNKGFDENCLIKCHEYYDMEYPNYDFHCTLQKARKIFPDLSNHQLHTVSEHIGFRLENHHNALADAEACAKIAIAIL